MPLSPNCWRWHICHCCRLFDARKISSTEYQVISGATWKSRKYVFDSLHTLLNYWCDITALCACRTRYDWWCCANIESDETKHTTPAEHFDWLTCVTWMCVCVIHESWFMIRMTWKHFPIFMKNKCALSRVDILATENKQHFCRQIYFDYMRKKFMPTQQRKTLHRFASAKTHIVSTIKQWNRIPMLLERFLFN